MCGLFCGLFVFLFLVLLCWPPSVCVASIDFVVSKLDLSNICVLVTLLLGLSLEVVEPLLPAMIFLHDRFPKWQWLVSVAF